MPKAKHFMVLLSDMTWFVMDSWAVRISQIALGMTCSVLPLANWSRPVWKSEDYGRVHVASRREPRSAGLSVPDGWGRALVRRRQSPVGT